MDRTDRKKQIRQTALMQRDSLTAGERRDYSEAIVKKLTALPCYRQAGAVLTYISFRSEVDTALLLEQAFADEKAVFAPRVSGKEMDFFRIFGAEDLTEGYHGIREPKGCISYTDWVSQKNDGGKRKTLICMPGAAFDRKRHRIGYGGGFYDRYLMRLAESLEEARERIITVALAFSCQIFEEIPWEAHDICPGKIVTETDIV